MPIKLLNSVQPKNLVYDHKEQKRKAANPYNLKVGMRKYFVFLLAK